MIYKNNLKRGSKIMRSKLAIEVRIKLLESRGKDNSNIVRKLKRQLRKYN